MPYKATNPGAFASLFSNYEETLIWSCLQGVMGEIYVDKLEHPVSAMAVLGDFTFFAGVPNRELVSFQQENKDFMIMAGENREWERLIEACHMERAKKVERYAIKKEPDIFDKEKLRQAVAALSKDYEIRMIDRELYHKCLAEEWSRDLVSNFTNETMYEQLGLGVVLLKDGEVLSGASSYSRYKEGIEIEIDTREDCRRKGFAYACGAKLILECLERGLYPSWDAQNLWSVALAEKLGYHYSHTYTAYEVVY